MTADRPRRSVVMCHAMPQADVAPEDQYAAERGRLARAIHKRVNSSRIGATVPYSVGDAERAATAVILEGWTPPDNYAESEE